MAFWNFIVEYRVTVIATLMTLAFILLKSYVGWCEKRQKTDGWFYIFAVTALPFLSPNRPGGTGQLSSRVAKMEASLAPVAEIFPKIIEMVERLEPLLRKTGPLEPPPTDPPDVR